MRTPLIIDVDTGIDDSLALLYACASAEAEILAVTLLGQRRGPAGGGEHSRGAGAGRPNRHRGGARTGGSADQAAHDSPETHGPRGIGYAELPEPSRPLSSAHAADLMIEEAKRQPGEALLITVGPLTNLAVALVREPELPRLLKGLVMMAGSYRSAGNTAPTTEWNVAVDPEAMAVVLAGWEARTACAAASGAGPRRDRAGEDDARSPGRLHHRPAIPTPTRCCIHRRRAALLHGVPQPLRRLLRRVHPRRAGRRVGTGSET